jgi:hypothetical protein
VNVEDSLALRKVDTMTSGVNPSLQKGNLLDSFVASKAYKKATFEKGFGMAQKIGYSGVKGIGNHG